MQTSQPTTGSGRPSTDSVPIMVGWKGSTSASRRESTATVSEKPPE